MTSGSEHLPLSTTRRSLWKLQTTATVRVVTIATSATNATQESTANAIVKKAIYVSNVFSERCSVLNP